VITTRFISHGPLGEGAGPAFLDGLAALTAGQRNVAALHSVVDGRWSVIGVDPLVTLEFSPDGVGRWINPGALPVGPVPAAATILDKFDAMLATIELGPPPVSGMPLGWLGWVSYDIGRHLEHVGAGGGDDTRWPLLRWTLFETYYVLDHQRHEWWPVVLESPGSTGGTERLDQMVRVLAAIKPGPHPTPAAGKIVQQTMRADYCRQVQRVLAYIGAGDIYQANLAQRWTIDTPTLPPQVFERLCQATPASYAAFFQFGDRAVASASPELFVERHGAALRTRPIKGTRPRNRQDAAADTAWRGQLWASTKDQAELAMIVDLLRNDLGRICRFGTVQVVNPRQLEEHPTVWHTAATIVGQLADPSAGWGRIIAALCPGGSITGAPKIRAMQIIAELEEFRRGLYCGNIGWIGSAGTGTLNIAIRTLQMQQHGPQWRAWAWAGGGVVADSDPDAEFEETLHKVAAPCAALGVVAG